MAQVNVGLWFENLTLGPGEAATFFEDNVSQENVRWFSAIPINTLIDDFVAQDQLIEITRVFHILKGKNHALDGTGGMGTVQVNVTVQNLDTEKPVTFNIFKAETR